jgi:predicted dehydrogenase
MSSPRTPVRFLVIGCGGIVQNAHLPAFEKHPGRLRLVGATDPSAAAREAVASRTQALGPVRTFDDPATALRALRGDIDAVLVTTPHHLHFPQAALAVEAGLPVLVEKPVCNNLDETRRLLALARNRGVLVVAGQNRRYDPKAAWAKRWMTEQRAQFGELRTFDIRGWQNIEAWIATKPDKSADFWILDKNRAGGGVVVSLLVHYLDMVRHLTGLDFVEASARGRFDAPFRNGAESSCCALLTLSNGAVGTLHANYLARKSFHPNEVFNLIGERGYLGTEQGWRYATTGGQEPTGWDWQFEGMMDVPDDPALKAIGSSFIAQLLAFADAVQGGPRPMSTLEDNFNTMAVVEAIAESLVSNGAPVRVPSTP